MDKAWLSIVDILGIQPWQQRLSDNKEIRGYGGGDEEEYLKFIDNASKYSASVVTEFIKHI